MWIAQLDQCEGLQEPESTAECANKCFSVVSLPEATLFLSPDQCLDKLFRRHVAKFIGLTRRYAGYSWCWEAEFNRRHPAWKCWVRRAPALNNPHHPLSDNTA